MPKVTNAIRKLREERGISREELAHRVGVHLNTIVNWETGRNDIRSSELLRLAKALDCTVEDILAPAIDDEEADERIVA